MTEPADLDCANTEDVLPRCVPWQAKYREGVIRLFSDVPYKAELWQWQFESNPFGLPFSPVVLVDAGDSVVGFNGVMAVRATDRVRTYRFYGVVIFTLPSVGAAKGLAV
jgi:hypothetical protein